jgi:uncharacterized membrane protein
MIEIIPNWHPIFVHFTVALFSASVGFYTLALITQKRKITQEFETVSRWCLWSVAAITVITVIAGLYAYNTVKHDEISHAAMTIHRNWGLTTATAIIILSLWSYNRYLKNQTLSVIFYIGLLITQVLLLSTAWRGAELVFRYGLGVMSLPQAEGEGHNHTHGGIANTHDKNTFQPMSPT